MTVFSRYIFCREICVIETRNLRYDKGDIGLVSRARRGWGARLMHSRFAHDHISNVPVHTQALSAAVIVLLLNLSKLSQ